MYMRYQKNRHQDGGMANSTEEDYINFHGYEQTTGLRKTGLCATQTPQ